MPVALTAEHVRWAKMIAARTPHPDPAMCVSDALLGLLRASRLYNGSSPFESYALLKIRRAIQDGLRGEGDHLSRTHRQRVMAGRSADVVLVSADAPVFDRSTSRHRRAPRSRDVDLTLTVNQALERLDSRAGAVVRMRYLDWPVADIAEFLGVSEGRVSQLYRQGLDELQVVLGVTTSSELLAA